MRYSRNRSMRISRPSPYRSWSVLLTLIVVALLLLLLDQSGRLGGLRAQAVSLISPAMQVFTGAFDRVRGVGLPLTELQQLQEENAALRKQLGELEAERIKALALIRENEQLRDELKIEQAQPWNLLTANVAALTPDTGRHTLLISVGEEQGVQEGMAVIGQEGSSPPTLIGVVERVQPRSATVLLITDYGSAISASVLHNGTASEGVVQGQWQRGSRLELQQIARDAVLSPGDVVTTAGLTAQFGLELPRAIIPRNIPIGIIEGVRLAGQQQVADVRPYLDPTQARTVWVLLSADE